MNLPSKEEMRLRFWALSAAIDATRAQVAPLREERDRIVNEAADRDRTLMSAIQAIEADVEPGVSLYDAQMEQAQLARFLGNVGSDPNA